MSFTWTRDTICAHQDCDNHADPRWMAYCEHKEVHYICDGHRVAEGEEPPVEHPWTPYIDPCNCLTWRKEEEENTAAREVW